MQNDEFKRPRIPLTRNLRIPNEYTLALDGECRDFAFNEERVTKHKGQWRAEVFRVDAQVPVDLEIGTGNGVHFSQYSANQPSRCLVGVELKYKPLIQSIRSVIKKGANNARICRYHAFNIDEVFETQEINNIFMHFPDPWTSPRKTKNRMINQRMLDLFWKIQRVGSFFELKTDSLEFFDWSLEQLRQFNPGFKISMMSKDLKLEDLPEGYVITTFERIFRRQKIKINYLKLEKN